MPPIRPVGIPRPAANLFDHVQQVKPALAVFVDGERTRGCGLRRDFRLPPPRGCRPSELPAPLPRRTTSRPVAEVAVHVGDVTEARNRLIEGRWESLNWGSPDPPQSCGYRPRSSLQKQWTRISGALRIDRTTIFSRLRDIHRRPVGPVRRASQHHLRLIPVAEFHHPDIIGFTVSPGAPPGDPLPAAVPDSSIVFRDFPSVSMTGSLGFGGIEEEDLGNSLPPASMVKASSDAAGLRATLPDRLREKGDLVARSARLINSVDLAHVTEPRGMSMAPRILCPVVVAAACGHSGIG